MDVSKSEPEIYQGKRIGWRRNLSRYRSFLISRKLSRYSLSVGFFTLGIQIFDSLEIYQGEERGQFQMPLIFANGPAIWGGCVTRRKHRAGSWYFSRKAVPVQGGYGTCFCNHGVNFIACWSDRGTSLLSDQKVVVVEVR